MQRVVKLAKYLPLHGVRPSVLTVRNPSVPLRDESLLADVPLDVPVERAPTLEPGYRAKAKAWQSRTSVTSVVARNLLFPDPQVLWQPAAHAALIARIACERDDVMLVSGPPFSQFLLAPLARASGLGVVLDYRDEWSTLRASYEMGRSAVARALGDSLEAALLRRAHAVVTATEEFRENLLARFPSIDPARVHAIPNGYDPDDFPADLPEPPRDRFVLTYAGTAVFCNGQDERTRAPRRGEASARARARPRAPDAGAIRRPHRGHRAPVLRGKQCAGCRARRVRAARARPPRARRESPRALSARRRPGCRAHLPCKGVRADAPRSPRAHPRSLGERAGQARLSPLRWGRCLPPRDEEAIASELHARLRTFASGVNGCGSWRNGADLRRYDRRALAGEFAEVLREAASRSRRGRRRGS